MPVFALLTRRLAAMSLSLLLFSTSIGLGARAQQPDLERCSERPTVVEGELYGDNARWCVEGVVHDRLLEPLSFTAMEVAP
ncbi:MAG: hypothetical protein OXG85_17130, partial [Chloroflexi bacterium]|nr:hypothetical protein [Chloroflexota bacterium]